MGEFASNYKATLHFIDTSAYAATPSYQRTVNEHGVMPTPLTITPDMLTNNDITRTFYGFNIREELEND